MLVRDRMTSNPIALRPGSDPLAGLAICKSGGFCHLPVVDEAGHLVGMVTEDELKHFLATAPPPGILQRQHRVEQVMKPPVATVSPDHPLEEAARLMIYHHLSGLPVVDETGRLVGIITRSDIFAQFAEALGANTPAIRVTVRVLNRPGELAKLAERIAQTGGNICSVVSHSSGTISHMELTLRVEGVERETLLAAIQADPGVEVSHVWEREVQGP